MGLEGLRGGAARLLRLVERRRLHLEEAAAVEEPPDGRDDPRPLAEDLADPRRHDEVDVPLPVALLDVGEPVPLLGERAHRLREDGEGPRLDRQLAGLGPGGRPLRGDDVADVEELEDLEVPLGQPVLLQPDLEVTGPVLDLEERHLPEGLEGEDAAGERPVAGVLRDLLRRGVAVPGEDVGREVARREAVAEGVHAERAERLGLPGALRDDLALGRAQVVAGRGGGGGLLVSHPSGLSGGNRGARLVGRPRRVNAKRAPRERRHATRTVHATAPAPP